MPPRGAQLQHARDMMDYTAAAAGGRRSDGAAATPPANPPPSGPNVHLPTPTK